MPGLSKHEAYQLYKANGGRGSEFVWYDVTKELRLRADRHSEFHFFHALTVGKSIIRCVLLHFDKYADLVLD